MYSAETTMTRSHDKTYIAKLGFADPDRRSQLHDTACQYLLQPDVMAKLAGLLPRPKSEPPRRNRDPYRNLWEETLVEEGLFHSARGELEVHIAKGEDKYKTTIGFIDVVVDVTFRDRCRSVCIDANPKFPTEPQRVDFPLFGGPNRKYEGPVDPWGQPTERVHHHHSKLAIEVKANRATAGDVLRQLSLYREYYNTDDEFHPTSLTWMLATCYPIPQREFEVLKDAKVLHVQLSPERIEAWAKGKDETAYVAPIV